jgi:NAD(P)-dependent dehydrogenase (short-subunit alcohol dehydrogenase family)
MPSNPAKADEVVAELKATGAHAVAVQADVANAADVGRLFTQALEVFGSLDVVVHCAGGGLSLTVEV